MALITCLLTVWTKIVRDDGNGMLFLELVMAAVVSSFAGWFRLAGMARSMIGIAVMQALVSIAVANAPSAAGFPGGPSRALLFTGLFALLWLVSAAFFVRRPERSRCQANRAAAPRRRESGSTYA